MRGDLPNITTTVPVFNPGLQIPNAIHFVLTEFLVPKVTILLKSFYVPKHCMTFTMKSAKSHKVNNSCACFAR